MNIYLYQEISESIFLLRKKDSYGGMAESEVEPQSFLWSICILGINYSIHLAYGRGHHQDVFRCVWCRENPQFRIVYSVRHTY
jgi:hypothetical protein